MVYDQGSLVERPGRCWVSIVVSDPRFHNRRVAVTWPLCHRAPPLPPEVVKIASFCALAGERDRRGGTMVGTMPLAAASAVCSAAALGLLGCGCPCGVGRWRRQYTWDHAIALRGVSRLPRPAGSLPNTFTNRRLLFLKHCHPYE